MKNRSEERKKEKKKKERKERNMDAMKTERK